MKNQVWLFIASYIFALLLSLSLYFALTARNEIKLSAITDIIRTISTIAPIGIAIIFLDSYGLKKKLLEKSFDQVSQLIELWGELDFEITRVTKEMNFGIDGKILNDTPEQFKISTKTFLNYFESYHDFWDNKGQIYFHVEYFVDKTIEIHALADSPWMPVKISDVCRELIDSDLSLEYHELNKIPSTYFIVKEANYLPLEDDLFIRVKNIQDLGSLQHLLLGINQVCKEWLNSHLLSQEQLTRTSLRKLRAELIDEYVRKNHLSKVKIPKSDEDDG